MAFNLNTDVPLLLLPVRLETRLRQDPPQLLIRVFPDPVHVDSFDRRLSEGEIRWGQHFWKQTWGAQNKDQERNAWAQLAQLFGPLRAAWIAQKLTPKNPEDKSTTKPPEFPTLPLVDPDSPYMPSAQLLPDFWMASGTVYKKEGKEWRLHSQFAEKGETISYRISVMPPLQYDGTLESLQNDPEAGWLVNFDKAKANGMGLTVALDVPPTEYKISQLFVYGVKASTSPDAGTELLEGLLQAHRHTQGLGFVPQGAPTNNTTTAPSGYRSGDPGSVDSFRVERIQRASTDSEANHSVMASALGINQACLANLQHADAEEQQHARHMNNILWQSTWGDFLEKMLELATTHRTDIDAMKKHFVDYVRARGPLPALRIGTQPYGVLPVMALGDASDDAVNTGPVACLRALRDIWRDSLQKKDERGDEVVPRLKKPGGPSGDQSDFSLTLLQILAMAPTGFSYVGRPCTRIVPSSTATSPEGLANTGTPLPPALKKALDAVLGPTTVTPHQRTVFTGQPGVFILNKPLVGEHDFEGNDASSLLNILRDKEVKVNGLKTLSAPVREQLVRETLDLCSHRLDAWITSLATERLQQLREQQSKGIYIGGYGWVENLTRAPQSNSRGFIHAPSLAHATTAAVLRSGYDSRRLSQTPTDSNALAINLSSERVRLALHLIDGVRAGQSLGTLLGYRFERGPHEQELDRFIPAFRDIAPGSTELVSTDDPADVDKAKLANVVLDGIALLEIYKKDKEKSDQDKKIKGDLLRHCQAELDRLDEAVDAVADLVLAESVHHVAQGNHVRVGATLEAIARGEAPPPELEFIRTPRSGLNHTHRINLVFGAPPTDFPWGMDTARAQAEPLLNAWVAQLLGPGAEEASCQVTYTDPNAKPELHTESVTIQGLRLAPLDLVYLLEGEVGGQQSEIERRILYQVLKDRPSVTHIALDFHATTGTVRLSLAES